MIRLRLGCCVLAVLALVLSSASQAQTISGTSLAYRSSGTASGTDWTLSQDGYVGTYIKLAQAGDVTISAQANGQAGSGADPNMNFVLADSNFSFDVTPDITSNSYSHTFSLPAGTYLLRTEFNNQDAANDRKLTVSSLSISGATVENLPINNNLANQQTNDGYALAAADDYIKNYRQGAAQLTLTNAIPGSNVHVKLKEHAFNFGTEVGGTSTASVNTFLNNTNYKNNLLAYFNTVTQGNAGKWDSRRAVARKCTDGRLGSDQKLRHDKRAARSRAQFDLGLAAAGLGQYADHERPIVESDHRGRGQRQASATRSPAESRTTWATAARTIAPKVTWRWTS